MNKINIATNIFKKLKQKEKDSIKNDFKEHFDIDIKELVFKEEDNIDSARLVLKDIDLKTFISEIILWDKFFDIIKLLKNISAIRCKNNDYQYWLIDTSNNSAINIAFAVNEKITIDLLASSLKTFLNGEIFEKKVEEKKDKIILVGWDTENLRWMSDII